MAQATFLGREEELAGHREGQCPLRAKLWGPETEAIGVQARPALPTSYLIFSLVPETS